MARPACAAVLLVLVPAVVTWLAIRNGPGPATEARHQGFDACGAVTAALLRTNASSEALQKRKLIVYQCRPRNQNDNCGG